MRWLHGRTSGVFGADQNAAVFAATGQMAVTVTDGIGWITDADGNGIVWWNDQEAAGIGLLTLPIEMADSVRSRIDRVIVSWATTDYTDLPQIRILKGTPDSAPVAPALTNDTLVRQLSLARITIPAGATAITNDMIVDERLDESVCGIVTEQVSVDTSMIQAQVTALVEKVDAQAAESKTQIENMIAELEYSLEQVLVGNVPAHAVTHRAGGADELTPEDIGAARPSTVIPVSLPVSGWTASGDDFTQAVSIPEAGASSKVDLQPDAATIAALVDSGTLGLYIQNDNGTFTAYAIGAAPSIDLTVQATLTEVLV